MQRSVEFGLVVWCLSSATQVDCCCGGALPCGPDLTARAARAQGAILPGVAPHFVAQVLTGHQTQLHEYCLSGSPRGKNIFRPSDPVSTSIMHYPLLLAAV